MMTILFLPSQEDLKSNIKVNVKGKKKKRRGQKSSAECIKNEVLT